MGRFQVVIATLLFSLMGCTDTASQHKNDVQQPAQSLAAEVVYLPPFSEMLTSKHKRVEPVFSHGMLISFEGSQIVFFDPSTQSVFKRLSGYSVQSEPVLLDDGFLFVTKEYGLAHISWPDLELVSSKKLEAPLVAKPLILDNQDVLLQYVHNSCELLDKDFNFKWKASIPSSTHYYQSSAYQPAADDAMIYLAAPGNALVALNRKNGQLCWSYHGFAEYKNSASVMLQNQITQPIQRVEDTLILKISDGTIHLVDKNAGAVVKTLPSSADAPLLVEGDVLYYMDNQSSIVAYDVDEKEQLWRTELLNKGLIVALQTIGDDTLVLSGLLPNLYVLDKQDGQLKEHFVHQYHHARLLSDPNSDTIYGIDKFGVLFKLQPEKFG